MHLKDPLELYLHLRPKQKILLQKAGFKTVRDLLWHFPARYESFHELKNIAELTEGDEASIIAKVAKTEAQKSWRKKMPMAKVRVQDDTGKLNLVWFNQPYIANMLKEGLVYKFSGKVQKNRQGLYMANPEYELANRDSPIANFEPDKEQKRGKLVPIYPSVKGISSRWFQFAVEKLLKHLKEAQDLIPQDILKRYNLPGLLTSLRAVHKPKTKKTAEGARKRFAFEEIFYIQLSRTKDRLIRQGQKSFKIAFTKKDLKSFTDLLPFSLTRAQKKAINDILADLQSPSPMARLLEGDVGSGKTAVAATAAFAAAQNDLQTAYMAPTEVLSRQHFAEFIERFAPFRKKIGLITSSECLKFPSKISGDKATHISRSQLLKWVANGEIPILIGTHSLIQDKVKFQNLGLVIIDEQHRFGINQRAVIAHGKSRIANRKLPHLLSMTATPIPRTLALTIYGDLDLTLLDEMPPGRKKIQTIVVPPKQRARAYEQMREEIKKGRQAYVVCPRIEEESKSTNPLSLDMKSVKAEYKKLSKDIFPEFEIGMLHGKLKPKEKEKVMEEFRAGKIKILVSTSVIEVGLNVPNATIMMIEGAERFGLAQLHQLRGRILRSTHQPYCFVFSQSPSSKALKRLKALTEVKNGFELAEYDLELRGPGELSGTKQWGISDIGMEALKNIKMVEAARKQAQTILKEDFELKKYPQLKERVLKIKTTHFE